MYLKKIQIVNFKNYSDQNLEFSSKINVFVGNNGSGKTNLLDAIYYLALTKSAFAIADNFLIRHGEGYFLLRGHFQHEVRLDEVYAGLQRGERKSFRENGLDYQKLSDHIGKYPVILISPDDVSLIREGSEARRKFIDGILSQLYRNYLEDLIQYNHGLKQRNSLLKLFAETGKVDWLVLEAYDQILIEKGVPIFNRRKVFIEKFVPIVDKYFQALVDQKEKASIHYISGLNASSLQEGLLQNRNRDVTLQRTSFGIHRDDYEFILEHGDFKRLGSQGQQKSFVIALKLAQWEIIKETKGLTPILLLDDVFDKLDNNRIERLLKLIEDLGQLFITDARPAHTRELMLKIKEKPSIFEVNNGTIKAVE